jgi:hydrogenase maturation protease
MKTATSTTTIGSVRSFPTSQALATAPILVLGLGNQLLGDDGAGLRLLDALTEQFPASDGVEFIDGGTQGLALTGYLADRKAVLVLDAMALGAAPGTVHILRGDELWRIHTDRGTTAHEGNALELFATARMLGYQWTEVAAVGIEPRNIRTGIGLTDEAEAALAGALLKARTILDEMVMTYVSCDSR